MKALITAFALLSFVAASTIPLAAQAQTQTEQTMPKKKHYVFFEEEADEEGCVAQEEDRQEGQEARLIDPSHDEKALGSRPSEGLSISGSPRALLVRARQCAVQVKVARSGISKGQ